jgi:hypothetical protein
VAPGLILLVFLAVLFALFVHRARRRVGLPVGSRIFLTVIVGFVLVVLVAWVAKG